MASLTRAQMRTELKNHGWSRFVDGDLDNYLNWGLQTTYAEGSFDRSVRDESIVAGTLLDQIPFTTISGGSSEIVQSIAQAFVKDQSGQPKKLVYSNDDYFNFNIRPNLDAATPFTSFPSYYYVWDLNLILYPKPNYAVDVVVDWMRRKDAFTSDSDTTGLPERFDKIVLAFSESYCHARAREAEQQFNRERMARDMMLRELGQEMSVAAEATGRVLPWTG